jgi:hypothetical protein
MSRMDLLKMPRSTFYEWLKKDDVPSIEIGKARLLGRTSSWRSGGRCDGRRHGLGERRWFLDFPGGVEL